MRAGAQQIVEGDEQENKNSPREKNCSQVEHNSMDMNGESFSRLNDCVSICIVGGGERRGKERRGEQGGS